MDIPHWAKSDRARLLAQGQSCPLRWDGRSVDAIGATLALGQKLRQHPITSSAPARAILPKTPPKRQNGHPRRSLGLVPIFIQAAQQSCHPIQTHRANQIFRSIVFFTSPYLLIGDKSRGSARSSFVNPPTYRTGRPSAARGPKFKH
jgi:hypothetical protein